MPAEPDAVRPLPVPTGRASNTPVVLPAGARVPRGAREAGPSRSTGVLSDRTCHVVVDAALSVHAALGTRHAAVTYRNALVAELALRAQRALVSPAFSVMYKHKIVGTYTADLLVDGRVMVNVVADPVLDDVHKTDMVRGLAAGEVDVGLVLNFAQTELAFARIY